jgi:hypothetical protein
VERGVCCKWEEEAIDMCRVRVVVVVVVEGLGRERGRFEMKSGEHDRVCESPRAGESEVVISSHQLREEARGQRQANFVAGRLKGRDRAQERNIIIDGTK